MWAHVDMIARLRPKIFDTVIRVTVEFFYSGLIKSTIFWQKQIEFID